MASLRNCFIRPESGFYQWDNMAQNSPPNYFTQVYTFVAQIPHGKVATYGQIAALTGHPRGARTVGWALHSLPCATNLPWHRVVNSQGRISTGEIGPQPALQQHLLEQEGVEFTPDGKIDLERFQHIFILP